MDKGQQIKDTINQSMEELEQLAQEIRLKVHLAGMDTKKAWRDIEPKLESARKHAGEATEASREAVKDVVRLLRDFKAHH